MTLAELNLMTKVAAGTAKLVRLSNKYLPRALGTKPLTPLRSGMMQIKDDIELAANLKNHPLYHLKDFRRKAEESIKRKAINSPAVIVDGKDVGQVNFSLRSPLSKPMHSSGLTSNQMMELNNDNTFNITYGRNNLLNNELRQNVRDHSPVSTLGHEATHAMLAPRYGDPQRFGLKPAQLKARVPLAQSLVKEAPTVLGPTFPAAKAYDQQVRTPWRGMRTSSPKILRSEIAADVGGSKFNTYLKQNRPDLHSFIERKVLNRTTRKIDPNLIGDDDFIGNRSPNSVVEWARKRLENPGWRPEDHKFRGLTETQIEALYGI